jgi:hypothetical protein
MLFDLTDLIGFDGLDIVREENWLHRSSRENFSPCLIRTRVCAFCLVFSSCASGKGESSHWLFFFRSGSL